MVYADGMLIKVVFSSGFTIMKGNRMKTMVLLRFLQLVLCFATGASFWKQYGAYAGRVSCSLQSMARSRTHEKSLARIVRLKEKEKKINRYKTHYGKEYKTYLKAKNDGSAMMPTVRNLTKRKLELQRSLKEMEQMIQFRTIATPTIDEIARDGSYDLFSNITFAATRKKIDYVSALYIGHISSIGDFLIIIEGNNKPHIQAIADEITVSIICNHFILLLIICENYRKVQNRWGLMYRRCKGKRQVVGFS